jgi:hypothetical protein
MMSFQELLVLIVLIAVLSGSGIWPAIARGLRELRGEHVEDAPPPPSGGSRDHELCFKLLGISPSAPWEDVERAYRQKAKIHHPDRGGDGDAMRALNDAYSTIKRLRGRP